MWVKKARRGLSARRGRWIFRGGVAGVGLAAEGVEDEDVEVLEEREALFGDVAHVGEVGGGAEAVAGDGLAAVGDGDALEAGAEEVDGSAGFGGRGGGCRRGRWWGSGFRLRKV